VVHTGGGVDGVAAGALRVRIIEHPETPAEMRLASLGSKTATQPLQMGPCARTVGHKHAVTSVQLTAADETSRQAVTHEAGKFRGTNNGPAVAGGPVVPVGGGVVVAVPDAVASKAIHEVTKSPILLPTVGSTVAQQELQAGPFAIIVGHAHCTMSDPVHDDKADASELQGAVHDGAIAAGAAVPVAPSVDVIPGDAIHFASRAATSPAACAERGVKQAMQPATTDWPALSKIAQSQASVVQAGRVLMKEQGTVQVLRSCRRYSWPLRWSCLLVRRSRLKPSANAVTLGVAETTRSNVTYY